MDSLRKTPNPRQIAAKHSVQALQERPGDFSMAFIGGRWVLENKRLRAAYTTSGLYRPYVEEFYFCDRVKWRLQLMRTCPYILFSSSLIGL